LACRFLLAVPPKYLALLSLSALTPGFENGLNAAWFICGDRALPQDRIAFCLAVLDMIPPNGIRAANIVRDFSGLYVRFREFWCPYVLLSLWGPNDGSTEKP
jgi:hypothetical protein